jgi:hypothetical protein
MQMSGRNVAEEAGRHQGSAAGYAADDSWVNTLLEPGMRVWRGVGGPFSPYHFGPNTTGGMSSGEPRAEFWEAAQVRAHRDKGYRSAIAEYEVLEPTPAAMGVCSDNWDLGWGGAEQFFIPSEFEDHLSPTGRVIYMS